MTTLAIIELLFIVIVLVGAGIAGWTENYTLMVILIILSILFMSIIHEYQ